MNKLSFFAIIMILTVLPLAFAQDSEKIRQEYCQKNWRESPDMCSDFVIPTPAGVGITKSLHISGLSLQFFWQYSCLIFSESCAKARGNTVKIIIIAKKLNLFIYSVT